VLVEHFLQQPRLAEPGPPTMSTQFGAVEDAAPRKSVRKAAAALRPMKGVKPRRAVASKRRVAELRPSTAHTSLSRSSGPALSGASPSSKKFAFGPRTSRLARICRTGMPGQMGCRVDNVADEIEPAPFDIAFSQEQSAGVDARMHSQRQTSRRQTVVLHLRNPFVDVEGGLRGTPAVVLAGMG